MSQIKVNTDNLKKEAAILRESANDLASLQNQLLGISPGANSVYSGQLQQAFKAITYGSSASAISSQNRLNELGTELLSRANRFELANETNAQEMALLSNNFIGFSENSPVLRAFSGLNKNDLAKVFLLLSLGGFAGLIIGLIIYLPDIKDLLTGESKSNEDTSQPTSDIKKKERSVKLGALSQKYESNGNPGAVSSGVGDPGGVSYGAYQMTSKSGGTVSKFLKSSAAASWSVEFANLVPGSPEFTETWKSIANRDPEKFLEAQHEYIKQTHYDPFVEKIKGLGLDVNERSWALQDVVWSTGVQHGPNNIVIANAVKGENLSQMSDEEIIKAIYAERGRKNTDGTMVWFPNCSLDVQKSVATRFTKELDDALIMLQEEKTQ